MLDVLGNLLSLVQNNGALTIAIASLIVLGALVEFRRQERAERRARDNFSIERRRLTEVNVRVDYDLEISPLQPSSPPVDKAAFMSLRLPIENIGDGPIDLLAVLVAGRVLSAEYKPGLGTRSRDVEWRDFQPLYWNDPQDDQLFTGLSTTKNAITTPRDFMRLASRERGVLRRIDAVNNVRALVAREDVLIRHRVFVVARGYPLGEILRQLGGGPPDPTVNVEQGNLQFQTLATPLYHRWQTVQEAILNINRFVFRIAIYDPSEPEISGDPLGLIAEPDAWRIFLLYHWEFVDEQSTAPRDYHRGPASRRGNKDTSNSKAGLTNWSAIIAELTDEVKELYPDLVLHPGWQRDTARWQAAQKLCRAKLGRFIQRWMHMRTAIELCQAYRTHQEPNSKHVRKHKYVDEGYPALIFQSPYYADNFTAAYKGAMQRYCDEARGEPLAEPLDEPDLDYRERWFALMQEGYLISKPFHGQVKLFGVNLFWRRRTYSSDRDIPADPRTLEPFLMRTHSLMTSVPTPQGQDPAKRKGIPL